MLRWYEVYAKKQNARKAIPFLVFCLILLAWYFSPWYQQTRRGGKRMTDLDTCIKEYMAAQGGLLTAADIQASVSWAGAYRIAYYDGQCRSRVQCRAMHLWYAPQQEQGRYWMLYRRAKTLFFRQREKSEPAGRIRHKAWSDRQVNPLSGSSGMMPVSTCVPKRWGTRIYDFGFTIYESKVSGLRR